MKEYNFSKKVIDDLNHALERFPQDNIDRFISESEKLISAYTILKKKMPRDVRRDNVKDILKHLSQTQKDLLKIISQKIQINTQESLADIINKDNFEYQEMEIIEKAKQAFSALSILSDYIQNSRVMRPKGTFDSLMEGKKIGRPKTGKSDLGLSIQISKVYYECFGKKPTKTENGPFWKVLEILRKEAGLTFKNVRRPVSEAIEKFKEKNQNLYK